VGGGDEGTVRGRATGGRCVETRGQQYAHAVSIDEVLKQVT